MKKMKKMTMAIAIAIGVAMISSNAFTAPETGDSLINLPANESTVTNSSVDVWFLRVGDATGYTVDIVGSAPGDAVDANACDNTALALRTYEKRMVVSADGLDCGQETTQTKLGDDDVNTTDALAMHLCKWTTPDLANGNYAIAINPLIIGSTGIDTGPELRTTGACTGDDTIPGYVLATAATGRSYVLGDDEKYQKFTVNAATGVATAKPSVSTPILPAAGSIIAGTELTFIDPSESNNLATWYELWVYDANNRRINTFNDNPSFKHWYKHTVDSELDCTTTNAQGNRLCTIDIADSIAVAPGTDADGSAVVNTGDTITWWIKGWNAKGSLGWSSVSGSFKAPL